MNEYRTLTGKLAMVTGASSGLGMHFAKTLASAGAKVIVCARRKHRLEQLCSEIRESGNEAISLAMDVSDADSVARAFDKIDRLDGNVQILVNNAGIAGSLLPFTEISEEAWHASMETNVSSVFRVSQQVSRRLMACGLGGSIINIASIAAHRTLPTATDYCTSKAAVAHLTKAMALDLVTHSIRVNAISPGAFITEINRDLYATEAGKQELINTPAGRAGVPKELDGVLLLLASDSGAFINGEVINVDGGLSCRAIMFENFELG